MNRATKIKLGATQAANRHRDICGLATISYSYLCGYLEAHITELCAELERFVPRASESSERKTTYSHGGGELLVYFDFEDGERQTWDDPGYPESVLVNSVFANGMDVTSLLEGTSNMESIEAHCLQEVQTAAEQADYDRAEERYQSRRDEELA